ncbi:MAG TPA: TIGR00282 family metallophosphoesterase [Kiritimatiellia bacterium]|nr:TIGR00282 family metallophosphoesterase [Kiritimatiellia bacterium]HRZ11548.1 TIGR00282 family metallophosphoesterase [Kiritimatiellia bacterium]HSA16901.1 TIGR00282 family metallophosphoesterase [Kiritimatiellia bacterium]
MRILIVGDMVGSPGRAAFARVVGQMRQKGEVDFVVANAENAAGGRGITGPLAREILDAGADVITLGDHAWDQKDLVTFIEKEPRVLRPANSAPGCPGRGWISVDTPGGRVTVLSVVGRVFMAPHFDCPFRTVDQVLKPDAGLGKVIIVDIHAEATSEKIALGRHLDGRVSAVVGTHTHVQTSDETILPKGTAYLTDLGMTGPHDGVLGRELAPVLKRFITGLPSPFDVATGDVRLEGLLVTVDAETGRAQKVKRVRERVEK